MPARFHSHHPGFGFAEAYGRRFLEIRWHDRLYLGWRWIVDRACALQLSSRNHPSPLADGNIICLIGALTQAELVEHDRQKHFADEEQRNRRSDVQRRQ